MLARALTSPVRMLLGLPPIYGITIRNRILQLLREGGLYHGRIHFRAKVKAVQFTGGKA